MSLNFGIDGWLKAFLKSFTLPRASFVALFTNTPPEGNAFANAQDKLGTAINDVEVKGEKMVEVRMANGVIEKFYPEELESDESRKARWKGEAEEVNRSNQNRFESDDPYPN